MQQTFTTSAHRARLARDLAGAYTRSRVTRQELVSRSDLTKGQVSRLLAGKFRRPSPGLARCCELLGVTLADYCGAPKQVGDRTLQSALQRVWDGTPEHRRRLIRLIEAIGPLLTEI